MGIKVIRMVETKDIINTLGIVALVYVGGNLVIYNTIGARSYFEATGYINGLVRGAGNETSAMNALMDWKTYWESMGAMSFVVNQLYDYGTTAIYNLYVR